MKKVILFTTRQNYEVDEQINDFVERYDVEIIDVKSNTFLDTYHNIIMTAALLIYEEEEEKGV